MRTDGHVSYDKFLAIGLGGTGIRALRSILLYGEEVNRHHPALDPGLADAIKNDRALLLGIDTDRREFDPMRVVPETFPRAFQSEFAAGRLPEFFPDIPIPLSINRQNVAEAIKLARNLERHQRVDQAGKFGDAAESAALINEYLPITGRYYDELLPSGQDAADGAGQLRALGRIAFLTSLPAIYSALKTAIDRLRAAGSREGRIRVLLFNSLAGGTGAGMFLDLAVLLKRLIARDIEITGHFLLPDAFESESDPERIWPNGYACLKELELVSRPQNPHPIRFHYRILGEDHEVLVQRGDEPIIDQIYLYDAGTRNLDWEADQDIRRENQLQTAGRAMADVALALCRHDFQRANKNKQNLLVGAGKGTSASRRLFHTGAAMPLRPEPTESLAGVLVNSALTTFRRQRIAVLVREAGSVITTETGRSGLGLRDVATLTNQIIEELRRSNPSGPQLSLLEPGYQDLEHELHSLTRKRPSGSPDSAESIDGDSRQLPGDQVATSSPVPRRSIHELAAAGDPESLRDWMSRRIPFRIHKIWVEKTRSEAGQKAGWQINQDDSRSQIFADVGYDQIFAGVVARAHHQLTAALESAEAYLNEGERLRTLDPATVDDMKLLRQDLARLANVAEEPDLSIRFHAPDAFFRQRFTFGAFAESERERAETLVRRFGFGPLVIDVTEIQQSISSTLQRHLKPGTGWRQDDSGIDRNDSLVANRSGDQLMHDVVSLYLRKSGGEALRKRIDRILARNGRRQKIIDDFLADLRQVPIQRFGSAGTRSNKADNMLFDEVMKPLDKLIHDAVDYLRNREDQGSNPQATFLDHCNAIEQHMHEESGAVSEWSRQARSILEDLQADLRDRRTSDNPEAFIVRVSDKIQDRFLPTLCQQLDIGQTNEQKIHEAVASMADFATLFVDYWLGQPDFELSRVGGNDGLKKIIRNCNIGVFKTGMSPGAISGNYVTAALPAINGPRKTSNSEITREVRAVIKTELGLDPGIAEYRSSVPLILREALYFASYEIRGIERYFDAYDAISADRKPLFHVLPDVHALPDHVFRESVPQNDLTQKPWECQEHGETDLRIAGSDPYCPTCVEEYLRGVRRLMDISRRDHRSDIPLPTRDPRRFATVDAPTLPVSLERYFFNGPDDLDWSRHDGSGSFPTALRLNGFGDELTTSSSRQRASNRRLFPSVYDLDQGRWKWVRRDKDHDNRFIRPDTGHRTTPDLVELTECFHCGFPIDPDSLKNRGDTVVCPRCRRSLQHCANCSDSSGLVIEPLPRNDDKTGECPNCHFPVDHQTTDDTKEFLRRQDCTPDEEDSAVRP